MKSKNNLELQERVTKHPGNVLVQKKEEEVYGGEEMGEYVCVHAQVSDECVSQSVSKK